LLQALWYSILGGDTKASTPKTRYGSENRIFLVERLIDEKDLLSSRVDCIFNGKY
jgi:hypothetical protein